MKNVRIDKLSEDELEKICVHFTSNDHTNEIEKERLVAQIGARSEGIEKTSKVFFSMGMNQIIQLFNNGIRLAKDYTNISLMSEDELENFKAKLIQENIKRNPEINVKKATNEAENEITRIKKYYDTVINPIQKDGTRKYKIKDPNNREESANEIAYNYTYDEFKNSTYYKLDLHGDSKDNYNKMSKEE